VPPAPTYQYQTSGAFQTCSEKKFEVSFSSHQRVQHDHAAMLHLNRTMSFLENQGALLKCELLPWHLFFFNHLKENELPR
jgi:hypothetical protein